MISPQLCIRCKGKLLCGLSYCPILRKYSEQSRAVAEIKGNRFTGSSPPSIFVSWGNYPNVQIAPLSPTAVMDSALFDSPEKWFGLPPEQIVSFREQLLRSNKRINVNAASKPSYELFEMQQLVMSAKPTAIDVQLQRKPVPYLSFHESVAPLGPSAPLVEMHLEENPKINRKVDKAVADTDLKANDALIFLYDAGFPVSTLQKLLSAGTLGFGKRRKFVPTRWSIVATDSNISRHLIEEKVKQHQQISGFQLFHSNYLDNDFFILLAPSVWGFEQLECWLPGATWVQNAKEANIIQDHEFFEGRKDYASNVEGAYYSARLAVAEHLVAKKRQAAAIVFREISQGYGIPLGVWVIRETVRNALQQKPISFSSIQLALAFLSKKLKIPIERYKKESKILDRLLHQRTLPQFS